MAKDKHVESQSDVTRRINRTEAYAEEVRMMFAKAVNDILALHKSVPHLDEGVMYSFDDSTKKIQQEAEETLRHLHSVTTLAIEAGIALEWDRANKECDELVRSCFGKDVAKSKKYAAWMQRNDEARRAFIARTDKNGMNLSKRIWRDVQQLKEEMEVAMTVAIGEGKSAASMSRKVRKYLDDPDLMFRRFRYKIGEDENGNPTYGRKWKKRVIDPVTGKKTWIDYDRDSYKTGQGVYKSAAKNAMRVTRTETNMAYRRADHERWQQMDFVLGIKIELSNQHPVTDICDFVQGDYPKDFVFDGWHPQCFCYATPILISEDEMAKVSEAFSRGETYIPKGKPVTDTPKGFKKWVKDHKEQIQGAKNPPYWVRNNTKYVGIKKRKITALEIAKKRHDARTEEEKKSILARWDKSRNTAKVQDKLNVRKGLPMSFEDANFLRGNVNYKPRKIEHNGKRIYNPDYTPDNHKYHINCQSCVVANELRRRGFPVTAFGNTKGSIPEKLSRRTELIWIDDNGRTPKSQRAGGASLAPNGYRLKNKTFSVMMSEFEELTKERGRYHISWCWKKKRSGHIITAERLEDGKLRIYDPQNGKIIHDFKEYAKDFSLRYGIDVLRVDNLSVNTDLIDEVVYKYSLRKDIRKASDNIMIGSSENLYALREEALASDRFIRDTNSSFEQLYTKSLLRSSKPLKRSLSHCFNEEEIEALEYIWNNPNKLTYIRISPLGEGKDMSIQKNIDNIEKKRKRKIVGYHIYSFVYKNKTYHIKTEEHLRGFEQFYSFTKE